MKRVGWRIFAVVILLIGIAGIGVFSYYRQQLKPAGSADEEVIVHVESGMGFQDIIDLLKSEDLIRDTTCARIYLRLNHIDTLQANTYELNKGMDVAEIMRVVSEGDFDYLAKTQMTVTEGLTIPEVAEIVAATCHSDAKTVMERWADPEYLRSLCEQFWFLDETAIMHEGIMYPLEGYLFPETYTITDPDVTADDCTLMMLNQMETILDQYKDDIAKLNFSVHEFLSFASLVEREALFDEDRPMIAGVFHNRLASEMPLESDISVLYALQRTGIHVTYDDLEVESLYNTYKYAGLPVGPISNVSEITIQSCINYSTHDYYYFYATQTGEVLYAKTIEEHEANADAHPWTE